uniref:Uncharacterized protein n=1 Tax=Rhizophora mucronata TaxID=61149 RepID=A0A2P2IKC1_RHIMU
MIRLLMEYRSITVGVCSMASSILVRALSYCPSLS